MATDLGSLVQLCCWEGGTLQTNTTGMCGECSQWMDHTGFATIQGAYMSRVYTAQSPECSATALSQAALHFMYFTDISHSGSWVLCKGTDLGWLCILCPSQVRTAQVTSAGQAHCPMWAVHLINLPGPCHSVPQVHHDSTVPGVVCVSFGMLISGCDNPSGCQPSRIPGRQVSKWEPAHSLVEDMVSGAEIAGTPCLQALAVSCLPICLWGGRALYSSWLALLWYSFNPLFCECNSGHCVAIEPFMGKVFFFGFGLSGDPVVWVVISHKLSQMVLRAFRPSPYPKDE